MSGRLQEPEKCCCLAIHSNALVYGYLKEIGNIFLVMLYIYMQIRVHQDLNLILLIISAITIDLLATSVFIIAYQTINLWCLEWYYISTMCIMSLKICYIFGFVFLSQVLLILPMMLLMLLDILLILAARQEIKELKQGPEVRYEFVNKLADRDPVVRIMISKGVDGIYLNNTAPLRRPITNEANAEVIGQKCVFFSGKADNIMQEGKIVEPFQNGTIPTVTYP